MEMTVRKLLSARYVSPPLLILLFLLIALLAYWPALSAERVWDDHFLIGKNPLFRSPFLAIECFRQWLYPFVVTSYFRPVQNLSYMADYCIWDDNLTGYHLTNMLLHAVSASLLAIMVRNVANNLSPMREQRNQFLAFAVGLIWLVHPIHHAAVAYAAGRADSLAALFSLGGWLLAERGIAHRASWKRVAFFIAAALAGMLALFSKEIAVTWIALFCLYHAFLRPARSTVERWAPPVAACLVVVIYFLYRQTLPDFGEVASPMASTPFGMRLLQALRALGDYISIVLAPVNLHMERQFHAPSDALRLSAPWLYYHARALIPLGIAGLVLTGLLLVRTGEDRRLNVFAVCWFFIGFLPISNLFPLNAPVAEHWIYMPSAALILLLFKAGLEFPVLNRALRAGGLGGVALLLAFLTYQQSKTWVTEEKMFRTAVERGGDTARARANLARILDAKGDLAGAEHVLRVALKRDPRHAPLGIQLASILQRSGKTEEALGLRERMEGVLKTESFRALTPWTYEVRRAEGLLSERKTEEAGAVLAGALKRWPNAWDLVTLQVSIQTALGNQTLSVQLLESYTLENWWHREAVILLAQQLVQMNRIEEAVAKYELAGKLDIHSGKPFEQISAIRMQQGRFPEALLAQKAAVRREPKSPEQRIRLSNVYAAVGNKVDALIELQAAADLKEDRR